MEYLRCFIFAWFLYLSNCLECSFEPVCNCTRYDVSKDRVVVICSGRKLKTLPYMDSDAPLVEQFFGQHNDITKIPSSIFLNATNLKYLDLSNNKISSLNNDSFRGLVNLEKLNLESNKLVYKLEVIPSACFQHVTQLRYLNLKNNIGPYTSGQYYPNVSSLTKLEILQLDGLSDDDFSHGFENLTILKSLDLSSKECSIERIKAEFFHSVPNLQRIDVSNCHVKEIWENAFTRLSKLIYLDVSFNANLRFSGLGNITKDLPFTSIKILRCSKIHKTFEMNTLLEYKVIKYLQNTSLTEFYIDSNRIQEVQTGVAAVVPKTLDVLSMADNMLSFGTYVIELKNLNITFLNISLQFSSHFIASVLQVSPNKKVHNLHKRSLDIGFPIPFPKHLKKFHFSRSQLQYDIPRIHLLENSLELIDVSLNLFSKWNGPLENFPKLKYLNMSNNYAVNISTVFFNGTPNLNELYIQNNLLGFSLPCDTQGLILKPLKNLTFIDLSQNSCVILCVSTKTQKD